MSKFFIQDSTLTSIADAIRSKTGSVDAVPVSSMADMINGISVGSSVWCGMLDNVEPSCMTIAVPNVPSNLSFGGFVIYNPSASSSDLPFIRYMRVGYSPEAEVYDSNNQSISVQYRTTFSRSESDIEYVAIDLTDANFIAQSGWHVVIWYQ